MRPIACCQSLSVSLMIFGPRTRGPSCAVTLAGSSLPTVREYTYLGLVLTSLCDISYHLGIACSHSHDVAQTVSRSTSQPPFSLMGIGVLPQLQLRHSTDGWRSAQVGSPSRVAFWFSERCVFLELGWPEVQQICTERLLSLFGRALATPRGERCLLPALIFQTALSIPGSWASHCVDLCHSLGLHRPNCVGHRPSLSRSLCSSLVPDSRVSFSEPFLARPPCCCCFHALSLPCPWFVTCGERWSARDRVWVQGRDVQERGGPGRWDGPICKNFWANRFLMKPFWDETVFGETTR